MTPAEGEQKTISENAVKKELSLFLPRKNLLRSSPPAKACIILYRTTRRTIEEFIADECFQRASALAFANLLALVPVAAISFFFLTKLEAFSAVEDRIRDFIFQNFVPARTDEIRGYVIQYTQNVKLLGIFGTIALILIAIFLFNTIEMTFNAIWHVKKKRPFFGKLTSLWTVLTLTPILIGVSFYLAAKLTVTREGIMPAWFVPYILNIMAFWFAYQFIPYTKVRVHAAVIAAVVAGILWEVAKGGFNWYIANIATFRQIYGSIGTVPVFLLWLYLTWVIVLLGTELAYAIQYPHGERALGHEYLEFYAVRAMAEITRLFRERGMSRRNTIERLKQAGIPPDMVGDILNLLVEKDLLVLSEEMQYYPAKDPSTITVREIVEAVSGSRLLAPCCEKDFVSRSLRNHFEEAGEQIKAALDGLNLEMLVRGSSEEADSATENVKRRSNRV